MSVATIGSILPTDNGSQGPSLTSYVPSLLYLAWKANEPEMLGVWVNVVPSTAPLASVSAPEVWAGEPAHVPLVNQLTVTVPVGVPTAPLTVALSWTVVPAATEVTTLCDAS